MNNPEALNESLALADTATKITDLTIRLPPSNVEPSRTVPGAAQRTSFPEGVTASKLFSALFGLVFRFSAALCLLASASYMLKSPDFLPPANIPCAAVIAVLGTPGLALLISINLLV